MDVIDPVSGIFALDIEGHWLSLFVDMLSVIFVLLCVHGNCAFFALGHFCLGLCVLEVLELIAGWPCGIVNCALLDLDVFDRVIVVPAWDLEGHWLSMLEGLELIGG